MGRRSVKMNNLLDSMIEIAIHETWWTQQQMDYSGITQSDWMLHIKSCSRHYFQHVIRNWWLMECFLRRKVNEAREEF